MSKKISVFTLLLLIFIGPSLTMAKKQDISIDKKFTFESPMIESKNNYAHIKMKNLPIYGAPGAPVLPFKTVRLLLPQDRDAGNIEITVKGKNALDGTYAVIHGQKYVPLGSKSEYTPPSPVIYESNKPFPKRLYSGVTVQKKMGYSILIVNLHPVEYIPASGKISFYKEMTVRVNTIPGKSEKGKVSIKGTEEAQKEILNLVDNGEILSSYTLSDESGIPLGQGTYLDPAKNYKYVIITNEELKNAAASYTFQDLLQHRALYGIETDPNAIFTVEWIDATYDGTRPDGGIDLATKIRNFIIDAYNSWGTQYVLLGGDADGADVGGESGANIVPARYLFVKQLVSISIPSERAEFIPADLYYACLDGTFDDNGNGIYGENDDGEGGGEVDLMAEIFVGRAPVDRILEMENFVRKSIEYENYYPIDPYLKNALLVGEELYTQYYESWDFMEELIGISDEGGYSTTGFDPNMWNIDKLYDNDPNTGSIYYDAEFKDRINISNNPVHLVNHLGHAHVNDFIKVIDPDMELMTNTKYFLLYSQSCRAGAFDNLGNSGAFSQTDCVAEQFVTCTHGAFAFIGNAREGYASDYTLNSPSQKFNREFLDALFAEDRVSLGRAQQDSKEDCIGFAIISWYERQCYYQINLFGDPAVQVGIDFTPRIKYDSHQIEEADGDGDGYMEAGETINMRVTLRNQTGWTTPDITAFLTTTNPNITFDPNDDTADTAYFGAITGWGTAKSQDDFTFSISGSAPSDFSVTFELDIFDGQVHFYDSFTGRIKEVKSISGRILDSAGKPMPNVRINYYIMQFADDMENGPDKWDADLNWELITSDYHSENHCWTDSNGGDFTIGSTSDISIRNDVHLGQKPALRFWHHYDATHDPYNEFHIYLLCHSGYYQEKIGGYKGIDLRWKSVEIPLVDYGNQDVSIKFQIKSMSGEGWGAQTSGDGWYIDDVFIGDHLGYVVTDPNGNYTINGLEPDTDTVYRIYADISSQGSKFQDKSLTDDINNVNFTFDQPDLSIDTTTINTSLIEGKTYIKKLSLINNVDVAAPFIVGVGEKEGNEWRKQFVLPDDPNDLSPAQTYIDISLFEASFDPENMCLNMTISLHRPFDINRLCANYGNYLFLDTDQDPNTGLIDVSPIGREYELKFSCYDDLDGYIEVKNVSTCKNELIGVLPVTINQTHDQLTFSLPLKLIQDDGCFNLVGFFNYDRVPDLDKADFAAINLGDSWLSVAPTQETVPPSSSQALTVTLDSAPDPNNPLAPGLYEGMIAVSSLAERQAPMTIPVIMKVYSSNFELPILSEGFEDGSLNPDLWTQETTANGRIRVDTAYPHSGSYSLLLDAYPSGTYSYAAASMCMDLSNYNNPTLRFYVREFSDEGHTGDGVFISDNGSDWKRIYDYSVVGNAYKGVSIDLAVMAADANMTLGDNFYIKFQFYDNCSITTDGYAIDDIELVDMYPLPLILAEGFEDGTLDPDVWAQETTGNGRIRVSTSYPFLGDYSLLLDAYPSGTYSYAGINTNVDLRNYLNPTLKFCVREFSDETHAGDGVFISDNGSDWERIYDYSQTGNAFQSVNLDLATEAAGVGITIGEDFYIKFQFYDNYPISSDGYAIDNIELVGWRLVILPRTGQTTSYYPGDDGDLQIGMEWPEPRFVDNGDGTVMDELTGLMWYKDASVTGTYSWTNSLNYCNNSSLAGFTDWRLPNMSEMFFLFCAENYDPPIPSDHLFDGFKTGYADGCPKRYWVSNSYYRGSWFGYKCFFNCTDFIWDDDPVGGWGSREFYFIPTRGEPGHGLYDIPKTGKVYSYAAGDDGDLQKGASWPDPRFTDNGDGTVTDNMTNLMWVKDAYLAGEGKTWEEALDYCNNLNYAGYSNWHLPNVFELKSIIDLEYYEPDRTALPTGHPFVNTNRINYWTSTSSDSSQAYVFSKFIQVDPSAGRIPMLRLYYKSEVKHIWPVRVKTTL